MCGRFQGIVEMGRFYLVDTIFILYFSLRRVLVNILLTVLSRTTLKPNGNFSGNFFELDTKNGIELLE